MISLQYYLLFALTWMISLVPFPLLYGLSDLLYFITFYLAGYRKETVYSNLRNSFPEKTKEGVRSF